MKSKDKSEVNRMVMDMTVLTSTSGKDQFYPTPKSVAGKMLAGIDWGMIENILEPSAGKGNLVEAAIKAHHANTFNGAKLNIDCIEIDPYLRAILKQNSEAEWVRPLRERRNYLDELHYEDRHKNADELYELRKKIEAYDNCDIRIIHDNFHTFRSLRNYQLILMNPPFADGDLHLLKALEIQKDGGSIVCLLNAETLLNPYTNTRQLLKRALDRHEAQVTLIKDAFKNAERRADVDVAIVRVTIPQRTEYHSDIWERMEKAAQAERPVDTEPAGLVVGDYIEQAVTRYHVETAASMELVRQYRALRPYIFEKIDPNGSDRHNDPILELSVHGDRHANGSVDLDKYLRSVRLKYWRALFQNEEFVGKLTSEVRQQYIERVDQMANYDFTLFNIRTIMAEMNAQVVDGVKGAILSLFDKLTSAHSWYPETTQNVHYFNGWAANKAHKIGKKSIIPTYGMFSNYSWGDNELNTSNAYHVLSDIEKVFDYLSGAMTDDHHILERLEEAKVTGKTRNIPLKYFDVDLYKKGTTHIKYRDLDLVDKMNIYAARNKNWLPPNYGRSTYSEMTTEEREAVDSFQGAAEYAKVLAKPGYYLSEPTCNIAMLGDGRSEI